jgi:hypothetical protein
MAQDRRAASWGGASAKSVLSCLALLSLLGLTSCAYTRPIYFKNPANGLIVTCGPYTHRDVNAGKQQLCVQRAAEEGLIRIRN